MKPHQTLAAIGGVNPPSLRREAYFLSSILLALLLTLCAARADGPDDDYLAVLAAVDQADTLRDNGKITQAHAKYLEAQRALAQFQQANPAGTPAWFPTG